jgi:Ca2+-binding RTX toxin-like protein
MPRTYASRLSLGWGNLTIFGSRGNDLIFAGRGNDRVFGLGGNDGLAGDDGDDDLAGGTGRDLLLGGAGDDMLRGGMDNDIYLIRRGTGLDFVSGLESGDRIDIRDFGFVSFEAVLDAAFQWGSAVRIDLGNGDRLLISTMTIANLKPEQFIISSTITGPSSSSSPYVIGTDPNVVTKSLLTVGDGVGGYVLAGIPDGMGAFDNGDGTFTLLVNHEIGATAGAMHAHGAAGSFVSKWIIDKTTLEVLSGQDLMQHAWMYNPATQAYEDHSAALGNGIAFARFCAADLAKESAFYNPVSGLGFDGGRLYLNGEEAGTEGRAMAHVAGGTLDGNSYELAWLGNMSFENVVASPYSGNKTVVAALDDVTGGQVYFYYGDKKASGNPIEMAGLTGGHLFGVQVAEFTASANEAPNSLTPLGADNQSPFTLADLGDASALTGAQLETASDAAGVAGFLRPEDGAWDTLNADRFYFVTTNSFSSPSQLWALDFVDASNPALGGTIKLLLDGSEGQKMFDNLTVDGLGRVILQEDPGNNAYLAKIWAYDPAADSLTELASHDPDRFVPGGSSFLTQDEESSGIIDVTDILGSAGEQVYLLGVQAHYPIAGDLVEGGQLLLMHEYLV